MNFRRDLTVADIGLSVVRSLADTFSGQGAARGAGSAADATEMTVAFGVDAAYVPHMGVAIASIVDNAPGGRFCFLILHDGIAAAERARLEACAPGQRFDWREITDDRLLDLKGCMHISRAMYYRLALPQLAPPTLSRVVYLDCDIVVTGDLRGLREVDLGGNAIAGVYDVGVEAEEFAGRFGLTPRRLSYFNSGVLLIDLDRVRAGTEFQDVIGVLQTRFDDLEYIDQDALNIVFWDHWTRLDPIWNVQRRMIVLDEGKPVHAERHELPLRRRPAIIHFTEINKPWSTDSYHPYVWKYFHYLRKTPYWDEVNALARMTPAKRLKRRIKTMLYWGRLDA